MWEEIIFFILVLVRKIISVQEIYSDSLFLASHISIEAIFKISQLETFKLPEVLVIFLLKIQKRRYQSSLNSMKIYLL